MTSPKTYYGLFTNELEALLTPLEKQRKKLVRLEILGYSLIGIAVLLFIISSSSHSVVTGFPGFLSLVAGAIFTGMAFNNRANYVAAFKENIVRRVINYIDPSLYYEPERKVSQKDIERSGLFLKSPDDYSGHDYVEGSRGKTYFCFSELRVSKSDGDSTATLFKGLFFIADFNKHFQVKTYVWSKSNPQLNFFRRYFTEFGFGIEKVRTESVDFESRFIVYSNDQVEARYILTPSFMERLIRLEQLIGPGISFSFVNTFIFVAVPIKDKLFEPPVYRPNNYDVIGDYYNTVCMVFEMIDELNLNLRIWNKE